MNSLSDEERKGVERMLALYPELREELDIVEMGLEEIATSQSSAPPSYLEEKVVGTLLNLEKEKRMDPADLPLINRFTDYRNWLPLVKSLGDLPLEDDGRHMRVLRFDEEVVQILVVSTTDIEEETHEEEYESFLILEGECKCTVGNFERMMGVGDYMEIPLHQLHDVAVVSEKVVAILQRISCKSIF
ncbi:MAG: cupin domain-containing protein [Bacteroidia bacterium]